MKRERFNLEEIRNIYRRWNLGPILIRIEGIQDDIEWFKKELLKRGTLHIFHKPTDIMHVWGVPLIVKDDRAEGGPLPGMLLMRFSDNSTQPIYLERG